jgi:cytochrome c peroxidase/sugar lactone lactonase YvrE
MNPEPVKEPQTQAEKRPSLTSLLFFTVIFIAVFGFVLSREVRPEFEENPKPVAEVSIVLPANRAVPHRITIFSGNRQRAVINEPIPKPLAIRVAAADGTPVANAPVVFAYHGRNGQVRKELTTDDTGSARAQIIPETFGHVAITASLVEARLDSVEFQLTVTGWISTIAGDGIQGFGGDGGPAVAGQMNGPFGLVLDNEGNLIFVDWYSNRIRKIDAQTGLINTIAGRGLFRTDGDNGPALNANMNGPYALKRDRLGNLFVSDYFSGRIRRIDAVTGIITTVAGSGRHDNSGDGGPALEAGVDVPLDIAIDPSGNIYVSDWHHNVIRRIDTQTGGITNFVGVPGQSRGFNGDDRAATSARLNQPLGLATDSAGNVYIADYANHRIRRVDAKTGMITTVAGNGKKGVSGDGGRATDARLRYPYNVTVDTAGNLYIADAENHRIRMVNADSGIITTIAGNGERGFSGDEKWATAASFNGPFSLTVSRQGELLVADYFNNRIRKIGFTRPKPRPRETEDKRLMRQARQLFGILPDGAWTGSDPQRVERIELGGRLFHETKLSKAGDLACSSCHDLANFGIDGRTVAIGHRGQPGTRNTPSVFNAALQEALFWDGSAPSVELQAISPITNSMEMAMESESEMIHRLSASTPYPRLFRDAFPADEQPINFRNVTRAIGAFERGLVTPGRFDDFQRGNATALSKLEKKGLEVFLREGCASCHYGPLLGGVKLALRKPYPNDKYGFEFEFRKYFGDDFHFKVPQLRNIADTGPYLHDGSAKTLKEAIASRLKSYRYGEALTMIEVSFSDGELDAVIEFLKSLSGTVDREYIASGLPTKSSDE